MGPSQYAVLIRYSVTHGNMFLVEWMRVEFQVIQEVFWRICGRSSSNGKRKTGENPALKLNIVTGSSVLSPEQVYYKT
jgi:hypothetical protein